MFSNKKFILTQSELGRAQKLAGGISYTIVTRPQMDGTFLVAMVNCNTQKPIDAPYAHRFVKSRQEIPEAIKDINRMFDKMGYQPETGVGMFDASRHRQ